MIPVGWLAPTGHWDANMLTQLFDNELYPTGSEFKRYDGYPPVRLGGVVVVIPGRYWSGEENARAISNAIRQHPWVLAIRISDEENVFDVNAIEHPNIRWWIQTPRTDVDYGDAYLFGVGYTPHFNNLGSGVPLRDIDVFIAAQNTHERRNQCFDQLLNMQGDSLVMATEGFTKGAEPDRYATMMCTAKVAPAPSGPATPDTFRTYEALQAHSIPIADDITPAYDSEGYWRTLYPDTPMPILTKYDQLPGYLNDALEDYPRLANRVTAWWISEKRRMARRLKTDLEALGAL